MIKQVNILGVTGSIGTSATDILRTNKGDYRLGAITAHQNSALLIKYALEFLPDMVVIGDDKKYHEVKDALNNTNIIVLAGDAGILQAAIYPCDILLMAIVGAAALAPTIKAIEQGRTIALANKECLVCAGDIICEKVKEHNAQLLPVDSEHNAIFQVFDDKNRDDIRRLILTASGGPFLNLSYDEMQHVTPEQALKHPNWSMGDKISIDSASMMNKGLEIIEAHYLFSMPPDKIDVIVHPSSTLHSFVEYVDGSLLAQLGPTDMKVAIGYALSYPRRMDLQTHISYLDLAKIGALHFYAPDEKRFPALKLARDVLGLYKGAGTVLNASNEMAVQAYINKQIGFLDIVNICRDILDSQSPLSDLYSVDDVIALDADTRRNTNILIDKKYKL